MLVGYARVSDHDQNIQAQIDRLGAQGCTQLYWEKQSGAKDVRHALESALEYVRSGDTLMVTRLDRLARSVSHLCRIGQTLERKQVALHVLDQPIDTSTPAGKLFFHMLAAFAEFELSIRKEQQRAGIAHARASGKHIGASRKVTPERGDQIRALHAYGVPPGAIAHQFKLGRSTVYRALREGGAAEPADAPDTPAPDV